MALFSFPPNKTFHGKDNFRAVGKGHTLLLADFSHEPNLLMFFFHLRKRKNNKSTPSLSPVPFASSTS